MHAAIRADLLSHSEPEKLPIMQRFFKDPIDAYCTYTPYVRALARTHGAEFAIWSPADRDALTTALWQSGKFEEGSVAIQLYARMHRKCALPEWKLFDRWLHAHILNWAHCDALCADVLGPVLITHPEWISNMDRWAGSTKKYVRRAALVAPLKGLRKGLFRPEAEALAARLSTDKEDIVRKAVVWLRKELAR
jgi:3-methyladenine DNA glycosylase AlkD